MPSRPQPYADEIEFLIDSFAWARLRSKRIEADRLARETPEDAPPRRGTVGAVAKTTQQEQQRRVAKFRDAEAAAKKQVDDRLRATGALERPLGLEALVAEHALAEVERTILLLATLVACGEEYAQYLQGAGTCGYFGGPITPEFVWRFLEMDLAQRIRSRPTFLPTAPLLKGGLIVLHVGPDWAPADIPNANIDLTVATFARIVGIADLGPAVPSKPAAPSTDGEPSPF